jgi:hypothetical protein
MGRTDWLKPLLASRLVQLTLAAITGALVGLIVFAIARVSGRNLFLITGCVSGVVAVVVLQFYRRAAHLTEVKITIPQFSELTFVVNDESRVVAWKLFVETVTRVTTQPLNDDQGLIREAMTSLYGLFATTRETLKSSRPSVPAPGSQTVEHLAVTMLNWEIRPFLSTWHPQLRQFEQEHPTGPESAWPEAATCRGELRRTQEHLRRYALGFARLAGVREPEGMIAASREVK